MILRLALTITLLTGAVAAKPKAKETSAWKETTDYSVVRDETTYVAHNWTPEAEFYIRCHQGELNVFIGFNNLVFDPVLSYRIDRQAPVLNLETWTSSSDSKAIGLWNTADSIQFLNSLVEAKGLLLWYEITHRYGQEKGFFALTGANKVVENAKKHCSPAE